MSDPMLSLQYNGKKDDPLQRSVNEKLNMQDQIRTGQLLDKYTNGSMVGQQKKRPTQVLGENG